MADITLLGTNYTGVPAIDLPKTGGGTVRFKIPDLVQKTITLNGTYSAEDEAGTPDGYDEVTVNVQNGATMTEVPNTYGTGVVITSAQGAGPSATRHTIYFEFEDETDLTIYAYYDAAFVGNAITTTTPATYDNKTVTLAQLDGVTWYSYTPTPSGNYETIYDGSVTLSNREFSITSVTDDFYENETWRVTFDGTEYIFTTQYSELFGLWYIGNMDIIYDQASTGDPIVCYNAAGFIMGNSYLADGTHTLKLERQVSA